MFQIIVRHALSICLFILFFILSMAEYIRVEFYNMKSISHHFVLTNSPPCSLYNDYEKGDEMVYELYVDSLFLVNFIMNLLLLLLVDHSLYRTATRRRLVLGAGVGALWYFLPFLFNGPVWLKIVLGICPGSIAMIVIAFRVRCIRTFFRLLERFLIYSVLMGGVMTLLLKWMQGLRDLLAGIWGVLGMGAGFYLLFGYLRDRRDCGHNLCKATLICKGSRITVTALLDSGNSLVEPISGKPVSVVEKDLVKGLWEEEPRLYRAIPYHSIGKQHGILKGFLLPELRIEVDGVVKNCRDTYIAVCEEYLSDENDNGTHIKMILNPLLLEEHRCTCAS